MKIVELKLDELKTGHGEGITAISLVKKPAIELNWIAFNDNEEPDAEQIKSNPLYAFKTLDEEQRIVAGPAMIPEKLIYRRDEEDNEYFVFFKADTIRELSERFLLQGRQNSMTLEHLNTINDLSVVESWIVEDSERDKSGLYGFNLPVGSWFVKVKVLNDTIWNLVKSKEVEGFSVEGVFAQQIINNSKQMSEIKSSKLDSYLNKIKGLFSDDTEEKTEEKKAEVFGTVAAVDATGAEVMINFPGEALEAGAALTMTVEGAEMPLPVGEYALPEGNVLVVAEEGIAGEIRAAEAMEDEGKPAESDGLKADQIDALVNGIAEIIANFQKQTKVDIQKAVKANSDALRAEFNKPAAEVIDEDPDKGGSKASIIKGLNKFVSESKK